MHLTGSVGKALNVLSVSQQLDQTRGGDVGPCKSHMDEIFAAPATLISMIRIGFT
jgi:hypothetical protein